jgi:hypothetical protein
VREIFTYRFGPYLTNIDVFTNMYMVQLAVNSGKSHASVCNLLEQLLGYLWDGMSELPDKNN